MTSREPVIIRSLFIAYCLAFVGAKTLGEAVSFPSQAGVDSIRRQVWWARTAYMC